MSWGISGVCVVLVLSVAACSDGSRPAGSGRPYAGTTTAGPQTSSAPTTTTTRAASPAGADPCSLLTGAEASDLLGGDAAAPRPTPVLSLPSCAWRGPGGAELQVLSADAAAWSTQVPALIDAVLARPGLTKALRDQLEDRRTAMTTSGGRLSADEACATFTAIAEGSGLPAGTSSLVTYVPSPAAPEIMLGQRCTEGRFTSIAVGRPGLSRQEAAEKSMLALVDRVHGRASGG